MAVQSLLFVEVGKNESRSKLNKEQCGAKRRWGGGWVGEEDKERATEIQTGIDRGKPGNKEKRRKAEEREPEPERGMERDR